MIKTDCLVNAYLPNFTVGKDSKIWFSKKYYLKKDEKVEACEQLYKDLS